VIKDPAILGVTAVGLTVGSFDGLRDGCRRDGTGVGLTGAREVGFLVLFGLLVGLKEGYDVGFEEGEDRRAVGFPVVDVVVGYCEG